MVFLVLPVFRTLFGQQRAGFIKTIFNGRTIRRRHNVSPVMAATVVPMIYSKIYPIACKRSIFWGRPVFRMVNFEHTGGFGSSPHSTLKFPHARRPGRYSRVPSVISY